MTPSAPLSLVGLLVVLLGLASSQTIDASVKDLSNKNADFAGRLYRAVASRTDDNVVLCPLTVSAGLLALLSATNGPTQEQLLQGLTLTGLDPQTIPDVFQNLRNNVLQENAGFNFQQGVAVLPAHSFSVSSSYLDLVQNKFGGNAQSLAYTAPYEAMDTINRWVDEKTGKRIQELISNLDPQTQLLITTAASYQTQFSPTFNSSSTQDERFFVDKYHVVMVPMMFGSGKYFLAYDRSVKAGVLKLPMTNGAAMLVVLPDEDVDITSVEEEVTGEKVRGWIQQLKKTKLEVQLPRFKLQQSYTLKNILQTLDITQVFEDDADTSNMGGAKGPKLTQVYHKALISVNEQSGDATTGGGATEFRSLPPRLTFNRPFIFVIYHENTNSLMFMGRVNDPSKFQ